MTKIIDNDGKEISLVEYCKGLDKVPAHWAKKLGAEKPAPKKKETKKGGAE